MKTIVYSRDEVREIDRRAIEEYGMPGVLLMENAGRDAAEYMLQCGISGRVLICAGKGNNAGDGFVMARHLVNKGCDVTVLLIGDAAGLSGDAAINFGIIEKAGIPITPLVGQISADQIDQHLDDAEWIVDALLGTGITGEVREPFVAVIEAINRCQAQVLAVDLPSGMDCDSGEPAGICVRADHTVTFVGLKQGFTNPSANHWLGNLEVVDIGVPQILLKQIEPD